MLGIISLTLTCSLLVMSHWHPEATRYARWIAFTGSRYTLLRFIFYGITLCLPFPINYFFVMLNTQAIFCILFLLIYRTYRIVNLCYFVLYDVINPSSWHDRKRHMWCKVVIDWLFLDQSRSDGRPNACLFLFCPLSQWFSFVWLLSYSPLASTSTRSEGSHISSPTTQGWAPPMSSSSCPYSSP